MKIAIYSRKSRATDQGESIQNQIDMCKGYANTHFPDAKNEFFIYTDDGFSGGNVDRPQFQLLLKELKRGTYDVLMCYRLDRISRNVSDFSSTLDILTKKDTGFVSIKESFDTTTPMGRAMIHIASVFAQLERETIAERVRDNMHALARTGRWLGGTTPTGFEGKREAYHNENDDKKFAMKLTPVKEEQKLVKLIFDKYIELDSLAQVETFCMQNDIKTKNDNDFYARTLSAMLQNPVYCVADEIAYDYFVKLGANVVDDKKLFDGTLGIMPYNRTSQIIGARKDKDVNEWIIAIGKHKGVIESKKWVKVQKMIDKNKDKSIRGERPSNALLSPLLRCGDCGARMMVTGQATLVDGTEAYYYKCRTKTVSKGVKCQIKNVAGHKLDKYVVDNLKSILGSKKGLDILLEDEKKKILMQENIFAKDKNKIEHDIAKNEKLINGLLEDLALGSKRVKERASNRIEELDIEIEKWEKELIGIEEKTVANEINKLNWGTVSDSLRNFNKLIDKQDVLGKRKLIQDVVREIIWDGEKIRTRIIIDKMDHG